MTTVTFDEVLALAQQLKPVDQVRLVARLAPNMSKPPSPAQKVKISPAVKQALVGLTLDDLIVPPSGTLEELHDLLESWRNGDEDEQRETFAFLKKALDEDRLSYRPLFPEETMEQ